MNGKRDLNWRGVSIWLAFCVLGLLWVSAYELKSGQAMPSVSKVGGQQASRLSVFVHPLCPCTDATLVELERLLTKCPALSAEIHFVTHPGLKGEMEQNRLWLKAQEFPRTKLLVDEAGHLASSLKIATSGQSILTDVRGRVVFTGGITGARGHIGENIGSLTVRRLMHSPASQPGTAPVFGCPLFN